MSDGRTIKDGFGSVWQLCDRTDRPCGLQVVRPGKVQCWCDSETADGRCKHSTSEFSQGRGFCRSWCKLELCDLCMGQGEAFRVSDETGEYATCGQCGGTGLAPEGVREMERQLRATRDEKDRLLTGLRQIIEGDYPADAGNAETWAAEIYADSRSVEWDQE